MMRLVGGISLMILGLSTFAGESAPWLIGVVAGILALVGDGWLLFLKRQAIEVKTGYEYKRGVTVFTGLQKLWGTGECLKSEAQQMWDEYLNAASYDKGNAVAQMQKILDQLSQIEAQEKAIVDSSALRENLDEIAQRFEFKLEALRIMSDGS